MSITATGLDCYCSAFCVGISTSTERIVYGGTKRESNFYKLSYLSKVHDSEELGCATTAFALGLVHPACTQTLHHVGILNSAYSFFSTFVF